MLHHICHLLVDLILLFTLVSWLCFLLRWLFFYDRDLESILFKTLSTGSQVEVVLLLGLNVSLYQQISV